MKKYQSIEQFRNVIRKVRERHDFKGKDELGNSIYEHTSEYPTLKFIGTVKLHGTNGGVVLYRDGTIKYQSRERELTLQSDNAGFMTYMSGVGLSSLFEGIDFNDYIAIYGEWCGGNIQKGVALTDLSKRFVIFDVVVDGEYLNYFGRDIKESNVYCIDNFEAYEIDIDFNNPELAQNKLIEWTLKVEEECPVGKYFGVSGVGEGIVFSLKEDRSIKFKSKGEKHSSSKVKVLNSVDVEVLKRNQDFIEYTCTENRLKQGLENIPSLDVKYTSDFIRWVANDILKEESDTLVKNNIEWKSVSGGIAKKCSLFFRGVI